jgi:NitT/TauT family transport system permease protein
MTWPQLIVWRVVFVLGCLGIWQAAVSLALVRVAFVPAPLTVAGQLRDLFSSDLFTHVAATLTEALVGFAIGAVAGVVIGIVIGTMPRFERVLAPFVTIANATPRIALAPLFVLWFGIGMESHVALVVSIVIFIVLTNTIAGAQSVDADYLVLARILGATRRERLIMIVLPTTVPWVVAALRISWAYALAGAVVGEMFLGQKGLGYLISSASGSFNIASVFAVLFVSVMLAWVIDSAIRFGEKRLLAWRPAQLS